MKLFLLFQAIYYIVFLGWCFVPVYMSSGVYTMPEYLRYVLYCIVLHFIALYYTVLYCTVQYSVHVQWCDCVHNAGISQVFTILYCATLYCIVLHCTVLYYTVLYCTVQCSVNVQRCVQNAGISLVCTELLCTVFYRIVQYSVHVQWCIHNAGISQVCKLYCTVLQFTVLYSVLVQCY